MQTEGMAGHAGSSVALGLSDRMALIKSNIQSKMAFHSDALLVYKEVDSCLTCVDKEMEQVVQQQLVQKNSELEEKDKELMNLRGKLGAVQEQLIQKNVELDKEKVRLKQMVQVQLVQRNRDLKGKESELMDLRGKHDAVQGQLVQKNIELDKEKVRLKQMAMVHEKLVQRNRSLEAKENELMDLRGKLDAAQEQLVQKNIDFEVNEKVLMDMRGKLVTACSEARQLIMVLSRTESKLTAKNEQSKNTEAEDAEVLSVPTQPTMMAAMNIQHGGATERIESSKSVTRSRGPEKLISLSGQQPLRNFMDLHEVTAKLLEELSEIDGEQFFEVKEIGILDKQHFEAASKMLSRRTEAGSVASRVYLLWKEQVSDPSWKPFKTVKVGGQEEDVVDTDDSKLQQLKRTWGEGPYNDVVRALMARKLYQSHPSFPYLLYNNKTGKEASLVEVMHYILLQIKQLKMTHSHKKSRRIV